MTEEPKMTDHIDYMDYGTYKGAPIHWHVLKQDGDALLMITNQIIETLPYNSDAEQETTWERSTLRKWLNGEFYRTGSLSVRFCMPGFGRAEIAS